MEESRINNCDGDEELAKMLHKFFVVEGHDEVAVMHPVDGERVITKAEYLDLQKHLKKAKNMSPAQRLVETKRLKNQKQIRFRTAMLEAKVYVVDTEDDSEENFGTDVDGNKMDLEGVVFVPTDQYVDGIELKENELGCFVSESLHKPPIRIVKQVLPENNG